MGEAQEPCLAVLSTLNPDGSRRWLRPRPSRGRFWRRRRALAYFLIALFTLVPYVEINGRPMVQLDIANRVFSLFGAVFYPTDTVLLALLVVGIFVGVFLVTALCGRVWCGWACPQTVYMEFVFRPIERFLEGEPGRKQKRAGWRKPAKHAVYLLLSMLLAHTFLAYFVGVEALRTWVTRSPLEHPTAFFVMAATTGLMLFDFGFFREQTCLVACPYGRLQSVMLDRSSLIVSYDPRRGEPRGKKKRGAAGADVSLRVLSGGAQEQGDCIDCFKCVSTCPTGIDIRNGLQMECIHCTQCIDACDEVMEKIGRPRGLIRYSSQAAIEGEGRRLLRPRVFVYPLILAVLAGAFVSVLAARDSADVTVIRASGGLPYFRVSEGGEELIGTRIKLHVRNRTADEVAYTFSVANVPGARMSGGGESLGVEPFGLGTAEVVLLAPPQAFGSRGRLEAAIAVRGSDGFASETSYRLIGPAYLGGSPEPRTQDEGDGHDPEEGDDE